MKKIGTLRILIFTIMIITLYSCASTSIKNKTDISDSIKEGRRTHFRMFFEMRYEEDKKNFSEIQLNDLEETYQIANKKFNTQEAIDTLVQLVNEENFTGANRIGCALIYLGQMVELDQKEEYLLRAKNEYSNSWYGDGVNVGAYSTYLLYFYYQYIEDFINAEKMKNEIEDKFLKYIDHQQLFLGDTLFPL